MSVEVTSFEVPWHAGGLDPASKLEMVLVPFLSTPTAREPEHRLAKLGQGWGHPLIVSLQRPQLETFHV